MKKTSIIIASITALSAAVAGCTELVPTTTAVPITWPTLPDAASAANYIHGQTFTDTVGVNPSHGNFSFKIPADLNKGVMPQSAVLHYDNATEVILQTVNATSQFNNVRPLRYIVLVTYKPQAESALNDVYKKMPDPATKVPNLQVLSFKRFPLNGSSAGNLVTIINVPPSNYLTSSSCATTRLDSVTNYAQGNYYIAVSKAISFGCTSPNNATDIQQVKSQFINRDDPEIKALINSISITPES